MIKVDLITGFLGSGKTTFIKNYAHYLMSKGEKIGIIENDYGAINIDMLLLSEALGNDCDLEMVVASDPDCHRRRFKTKLIAMGMQGYDRVIVEPSGIYDVDEFFDVLYEEPLDRWYEIGNVIAIVDAKLENEMSKASNYLLVSQIAEAGKVIFSKTDEATRADIQQTISHMNCALEQFQCKRRYTEPDTDPADITVSEERLNKTTSSSSNHQNDTVIKSWDKLTNEDYEQIAACGYVLQDHIKMMVTEDNNYRSLFYFHVTMPNDRLKDMVTELFGNSSYGHILRIKGFIPTAPDHWIQLNATASEIDITPANNGQEVIIVIGEALNEEKISDYIKHCSDSQNFSDL